MSPSRAQMEADDTVETLRSLRGEGKVRFIGMSGILVLNAALGWWWADPAAGYGLVFYAAREVREVFFGPG